MGRLLKIGFGLVVALIVIAVMGALFAPDRPDNVVSQLPTEETDPLDGPPPETPTATTAAPTATAEPRPTRTPRPRPTREPRQPEQVAASGGRCESVPPNVVAGIETGLTVAGGGSLRGAQAVRSRDFERVWFVAADLQGDGLEGDSDIAVWAMNDISAPGAGLTIAANAVAREFSDWGAADRSNRFSPGDDGMAEVRECVSAAL